MARGVPHSDETRAAVIAALLTGQTVPAVAMQFHLSKTTVSEWRAAAGLTGSHVVHSQKARDIGELVLAHVESALLALKAQADFVCDPAWLTKQSGADVAVLYGVLSDKAHRILSALESAEPDDQPTPDATGLAEDD